MTATKNSEVDLAERILRGQEAGARDILDLTGRLKANKAFGYARRILGIARKDPEVRERPDLRRRLAQQQALCTYKDVDLPAEERLARALEILSEADDLAATTDQETLGLAGAIHKRKWEIDGDRRHLERALAYYMRGYQGKPENDYGYTGINAAFVLDLLADQEAADDPEADERTGVFHGRARRIREDVVSALSTLASRPDGKALENEWWFLVTIAEAYFGLEKYDEAQHWLRLAARLPGIADWEYESTARQLATIARLQSTVSGAAADVEGSEAWESLQQFLGPHAAGVRSAFVGKIGLALSGGGFRASFFHIGVLARLAEADMLRHVEVLSCVSGGAIIGTYYYLELRRLLQEKSDADVTREDYVAIVQRLEERFVTGVQRNIRTRVAAGFWTNVKMIFLPNYSRTVRAGELYERELFRLVDDGAGRRRWLNDLFIRPRGEPDTFAPKLDNWRRRAKVPILILNATALNTGHVWQFTASWMGESPWSIDLEVDGNRRLRRMYYGDAPPRHRRVRLGQAVAASACVPGLFEPVAFTGLYPRMTVRLVDGGVHDNQGAAGLLEQDCTVLLVSDASGQMQTLADPGSGLVGVPVRANGVLQARVREAQFRNLESRRRAGLLRDVVFVHLKKDLDEDPVDWVGCSDPHEASDEARPTERRGGLTRYGVPKQVQQRLASIRTDLDSFTDAEADALMLSGYHMVDWDLNRRTHRAQMPAGNDTRLWRFRAIEDTLFGRGGAPESQTALLHLLDVASNSGFKLFKLRMFHLVWVLLLALALGVAGWAIVQGLLTLRRTVPQVWSVVALAPPVLFLAVLGAVLTKVLVGMRVADAVIQTAIGVVMVTVGWLLARLHLWIFDPLYLRCGRRARFVREQTARD